MPIELQTNISLETTPADPKHLVNVKWVTDFFTGKVKMPVRVVATSDQVGTYTAASMSFNYTASGPTVLDGVTLAIGDRVLLVAQADGTQNGIYTVFAVGNGGGTETVLQRADDFNDDSKIFSGVTVAVNAGTTYANTTWKLTTSGTINLDSTTLDWISVTPATGTAKYSETITGDDTNDAFTINHDLGTTDVQVQVWNLTTKALVLTDVTVVDGNNVEVSFAEPPSTTKVYRVVCVG